MKTTKIKNWLAIGTAILTVTTAIGASSDQPGATAKTVHSEKHYTGTVSAVNAGEHTITVKGWFLSRKTFNLGGECTYQLWDNDLSSKTWSGLLGDMLV